MKITVSTAHTNGELVFNCTAILSESECLHLMGKLPPEKAAIISNSLNRGFPALKIIAFAGLLAADPEALARAE